MKKSLCLLALLLLATGASAETLNRAQYEAKYEMADSNSEHWHEVAMCLANWPKNPFKGKTVRFRVITGGVKVFGLGNNVVDTTKTSYPQLIYIRPSVSVMGKATYELMNPNGWYCFKSKVNVMSKTTIKAACKAHITTAVGKVTVLGKSEAEQEGSEKGTTVMGKSIIQRDCKD